MRLVLASNNAHKLIELQTLFAALGVELISQDALGIPEAEEPHITFVENALAKARHAAQHARLPSLADDSGLCVDALDGAPGVLSARYAALAGGRKDDGDNNRMLLDKLVQHTERRCQFVSVLVAVRAADDPQPLVAFGRWEGEVLHEPRGKGGFGYDPLVFIPSLDKTVAELGPEAKNAHSHRAQAARRMLALMRRCGALAEAALDRYLRPGTLNITALPPLSLYVHLPWCLKKCPYCDFNSHAQRDPGVPEARYLDALRCDLEAALPLVWGRRIHSVFIGGGTPSLFAPDSIAQLIADVRARLPLDPGCEITLEANPGSFERERFRGYRAAGVTRLSIGVQSFDDAKLRSLGRVHDAAQAHAAVKEAQASFDTFNIDLMYALPQQTLSELQADLARALAYAPPHLSIYHLTLEPNTLFAQQPPPLPDEDTACDMLDLITCTLDDAGLQRYEVSAYARGGHRCVHNLNYWQFGDYLGIGAGAHSKLTFPHRVLRQIRWRDPDTYMQQARAGAAWSQDDEVARDQLPFEFMLNALRLKEGIELARFTERTGLPPSVLQRPLQMAQERGLIEPGLSRIVPTPRGYDLLNDLQALFLKPG